MRPPCDSTIVREIESHSQFLRICGDERLQQLAGDLQRDARAGVDDLDDRHAGVAAHGANDKVRVAPMLP